MSNAALSKGSSVAVTMGWSPRHMADGNRAFRWSANLKMLWSLAIGHLAVAILVFQVADNTVISIRGAPVVDDPFSGWGHLDGTLVLIAICIVGGIAAGLINRRQTGSFSGYSPRFLRPGTLDVSRHHLRSREPRSKEQIDRRAVPDVVSTSQALMLLLGRGGFVPLQYADLPNGVSPEDLAEEIALWRNAPEF